MSMVESCASGAGLAAGILPRWVVTKPVETKIHPDHSVSRAHKDFRLVW